MRQIFNFFQLAAAPAAHLREFTALPDPCGAVVISLAQSVTKLRTTILSQFLQVAKYPIFP
jgi:hypothetical protein